MTLLLKTETNMKDLRQICDKAPSEDANTLFLLKFLEFQKMQKYMQDRQGMSG